MKRVNNEHNRILQYRIKAFNIFQLFALTEPTEQSTVSIEKLIVVQLFKKLPAYMESRFTAAPPEPVNGPSQVPNESSSQSLVLSH